MDNARRTQDAVLNNRLGARRRAAKGLVANYIHELSARHGGPRDKNGVSRLPVKRRESG
jgi:hypothetical protein